MAGNSQRRGAVRKGKSRKGASVGTGGQRRKGLEPKGPTPKAEDRVAHPAGRRARAAERRDAQKPKGSPKSDVIVGKNAVLEALTAQLPVIALYLLDSAEADDRVRTAISIANKRRIPIHVSNRADLERVAGTGAHQGMALHTAGFKYAELTDLPDAQTAPIVIALDHLTDPNNVGAIARSAMAFGSAGMIVPARRAAPITAAAWKASAGALARLPVARVTNLNQALLELQKQGFMVIGLDGEAEVSIEGISDVLATGPLVIVVGSEGDGLARLTAKTCDLVVSIPMTGPAESLNASVATGIALYSLATRRG